MIKLNKLYSNKPKVFPEIKFKDGLNVVFASVTKELDNNSSHSLGKTTLVDLIDFCLLKKVNNSFFLRKDIFNDFTFFLEIRVSDNRYVTICRPANGKIAINITTEEAFFSESDIHTWDYQQLPFEKAKKYISDLITPHQLLAKGFNFRTGLRYCLRKQTQYENTFQVRSSREKDENWKPYLAFLLGLNPDLLRAKYSANNNVSSLKNAIKEIKNLPQESSQSLEAEITQIEAYVTRTYKELDNFNFQKTDESVSKELLEDVSAHVTELNNKIYNIDQRIAAINSSLQTEFSFEIEKIKSLFEEVNIHFPDQLSRSYSDLIRLNEEMSSGRKARLKKTKKLLEAEHKTLSKEHKEYSLKQQTLSKLLLQKDPFEKYKAMQKRLAKEEARVAALKERLKKIDLAAELNGRLEEANRAQQEAANALETETRVRDNARFKQALEIFDELVSGILSLNAYFYAETNSQSNLDFHIGLRDQTSVHDGFSYTRVLSASFDFSLLLLYATTEFYRFTYHDGLLESLDDRVKLKLIEHWRRLSVDNGLQVIVSVLDSDLPLDADKKQYFDETEIIRELHDRGDDGRLFKMPAF